MMVRFKLHMNMICNELTADVTLVGPSLLSYLHTGQCGRMTGDVWTASAVWLSSPKASEKSRAMAVSFGPRVLATTDSGFGRGGAAWSWSCELAFKMRVVRQPGRLGISSLLTSWIDNNFLCGWHGCFHRRMKGCERRKMTLTKELRYHSI